MDGTGSHDFRTKRPRYLHFQAMLLNNKEYMNFVIYFRIDYFFLLYIIGLQGTGWGRDWCGFRAPATTEAAEYAFIRSSLGQFSSGAPQRSC